MNRFGMYSMKFLLAAYLYFFSFIPGRIEVNRAGPIQISEKRKSDRKTEESYHTKELDSGEHADKSHYRMQSDLTAYDFWLDDIPYNSNKYIEDS